MKLTILDSSGHTAVEVDPKNEVAIREVEKIVAAHCQNGGSLVVFDKPLDQRGATQEGDGVLVHDAGTFRRKVEEGAAEAIAIYPLAGGINIEIFEDPPRPVSQEDIDVILRTKTKHPHMEVVKLPPEEDQWTGLHQQPHAPLAGG